jgi:membrane protein DedA with SNARE-associated domain
VEQVGLPLPAVPWLLAAGALSAGGEMNAAVAIGMSVAACVSADSLWFYAGRRGGNRVLRLFCRWSLAPNLSVERIKGGFDRYGLRRLAIAKFLPGLGTLMPPLAGTFGLSASRFLLFDSMGSFLYGAFYIAVGVLFHNQLRQILAVLNHSWFIALQLGLVLVLACIAVKYVRRRTPVNGRTSHKASESAEPWMSMFPGESRSSHCPVRSPLVFHRAHKCPKRAANRTNEFVNVSLGI